MRAHIHALAAVGSLLLPTVAGCQPAPSAGAADWTERDWEILRDKVRFGVAEGLDTLPVGESIGRLALSFVGEPYVPHTLEVPGPERLVINLREFDCVTFVENVLALTRFIREGGEEALADRRAAQERYETYLTEWRYRGGVIDGYPSRLHYFSEWLSDNARRGRLRIVTESLGGEADEEAIDFMSTHPEAYRQLADAEVLEQIRAGEARLNAGPARRYLPEAAIAAASNEISTGDVIAATSTVPGLDVAHTGFAVRVDGVLRMVHAPLVGRSVELSDRPLGDRIVEIGSQDGIMVARVERD